MGKKVDGAARKHKTRGTTNGTVQGLLKTELDAHVFLFAAQETTR